MGDSVPLRQTEPLAAVWLGGMQDGALCAGMRKILFWLAWDFENPKWLPKCGFQNWSIIYMDFQLFIVFFVFFWHLLSTL